MDSERAKRRVEKRQERLSQAQKRLQKLWFWRISALLLLLLGAAAVLAAAIYSLTKL